MIHIISTSITTLAVLAAMLSPVYSAGNRPVQAWAEETVIPTYLVGPPDPNPIFYFGRAYQGAEGRVFPYPLYDTLTGKKTDKTYTMIYLENEYVKIGVLPEIGGRIFSAVDKTNNYDFFYRQHVIKPALIGMIGAWISGGVEWNIPHHHRASSFLPVQYRLEKGQDGSQTVWVGELELRHRMRWAVGYTLRPGKSYLETSLRILNRTPFVNTLLCFANVAVHANENYQVIFPPGTQYATHHSKREFTTWPVATTRYGGSDFRSGVDVSWYKNHNLSNSMFAWNYADDFLAGYDHGKQAGTLSVADHHIVPGKKLWTWGNGPGGRLWDKILSDDDGPYIELMVGAYSDNQPDYSWIQPYEVKSFQQFWYPFRDIGGVKNANLEAAVNLEMNADRQVRMGFYTTSPHAKASALLQAGDRTLLRETVAIGPDMPFSKQLPLPAGIKEEDLRASLSVDGRELIAYSPVRPRSEPMPKPVQPPAPPEEIAGNEELYLAGQRIEQFHNPALEPDPYWEEALRRDPGDSRVNTAMGINRLKKGLFEQAERYLNAALARLTANYTSPRDGEAYYYQGMALFAQGREKEAFDAFYQATWSAAWQAPGYYALAEIASRRGDPAAALDFVERSIGANALNTRALNLKAALLRHLGRAQDAMLAAQAARRVDPLDPRALLELSFLDIRNDAAGELLKTFRDHPNTGLETAVELGNAGLWQDGSVALTRLIEAAPDRNRISPLVYYLLARYAERQGQVQKAAEWRKSAMALPSDLVFPFQWEMIDVLRQAIKAEPGDARAPYYLGTLLFDWQPGEAIRMWELSRSLNEASPFVHRNLAVAYARQEGGLEKAITVMEKAVSNGQAYPLHLFELDQLYEAAGAAPEKRLALLEKHHPSAVQRDDALAREIALKVFMGKCEEAIHLMQDRHFNVWEGGARFSVHDYWTDAQLILGHRRFAEKRFDEALARYQAALQFPPNMQTARTRWGGRHPEVAYWIGIACEALGKREAAAESWKSATAASGSFGSDDVLASADATVMRYYQARSMQKLGQTDQAAGIFKELIESGNRALQRGGEVDVFSKFGEQQSGRARLAQGHFVAALGYLGLGDPQRARQEFASALKARPDHLGAKLALEAR